ncbi:hypothetical protein ACFL5H_02380 [Candidatus Latescibacterota bacterium]
MKKIKRTRRILTGIGCFCMLMAVCLSSARAQGFISREYRPGFSDLYENFSQYDIRAYPETLLERFGDINDAMSYIEEPMEVNPMWHGAADPVTFDQFGNFLLPGGDIYNLTWDLSDVGTSELYDDNKARIFQNIMISSDEFSNWQTQVMIGTNMRAVFTSSTLKKTNFSGIRWDGSNRKNSFTIIAKAGSNPTSEDRRPREPQHFRNIFGGHWRSVLGDVLSLGGTFVFENRGTEAYSNKDVSFGRYGLLNQDVERYIYVIITSDSPEDESLSARVYDVIPVINGREENLPKRAYKIPDVLFKKQYSQGKEQFDYTFSSTNPDATGQFPTLIEKHMYSKGSWFFDLMNTYEKGENLTQWGALSEKMKQFFYKGDPSGKVGYVNIINPDNPTDLTDRLYSADFSKGYIEARGTDVIIYEILVPPQARKVEFLVNASNDYCIDIVACLPSTTQQVEGGSWEDDPLETWPQGSWSPHYDLKHCVKAPGRVNDNSNAEWVKVSYDRITGIGVYGLNMELSWRGLYVRGEINEYSALRAYPIQDSFSGESHKIERARAWFINIERDFGAWAVGGEVFDYPIEYMEEWGEDLIDDNDDNNHLVGSDIDYVDDDFKQEKYNDGDLGWEYPGLNRDWDGTPGWEHIDIRFTGEPFVGYDFDEVSYGDDFNHNGIIDERENDDQIDLPYDRDSRGQHFFVKLKPREYTMVTLGRYDINQERAGGRNLTSYVKLEHYQRIGIFQYGLYHRTERVRDNYKANEYYWQYFGGPFTLGYAKITDVDNEWAGSYLAWQGRSNNLAYRNSWYYTTYAQTRLTLFDNLNIVNNVKHDFIHRIGDLMFEGSTQQRTMNISRDISTTAFIHKIDYTFRVADFRLIPDIYWRGIRLIREKRIRQFSVIPQFKLLNYYISENIHLRDRDNHIYNYYPVLRFDYQVAPRTTFRCAIQGLPGLKEVYRNDQRPLEEENRQRMFLGFETISIYQGFNMLVTSGMRRDKRTFVESFGRREIGKTEYFITVQIEASGRN